MNYILRKNNLSSNDLQDVMQSSLSKGAKILYTYLYNMRSGEIVNNQKLLSSNVAVSRAMVGNYKRELKAVNLLHENKDGETNIRFVYLGSYREGASVFAEDWKRVDIEDED